MKEKLLLVGAGGFGRVVLEHASVHFDCAFLDDGQEVGTLINGVPVIGKTVDLDNLACDYSNLVVTIGNNKLREEIYQQASAGGYVFPNIIVPSAYISPFASVGTGCVILNNVVIQNNAKVGNGVILNPGVEIHHDSVVEDYVLIYTNTVVRSLARVCRRAHIGSTCTISNEAVVSKDYFLKDGYSLSKE